MLFSIGVVGSYGIIFMCLRDFVWYGLVFIDDVIIKIVIERYLN